MKKPSTTFKHVAKVLEEMKHSASCCPKIKTSWLGRITLAWQNAVCAGRVVWRNTVLLKVLVIQPENLLILWWFFPCMPHTTGSQFAEVWRWPIVSTQGWWRRSLLRHLVSLFMCFSAHHTVAWQCVCISLKDLERQPCAETLLCYLLLLQGQSLVSWASCKVMACLSTS